MTLNDASVQTRMAAIKQEMEHRRYEWMRHARPNQLPPSGNWFLWILLAGRGFGKTRTGAEWVRHKVEQEGVRRVALVAPTNFDARVTMVEGESGLLAVCPPWNKPTFHPSKMEVHWPNGAIATLYSSEEPNRLNGPQSEIAWCDEMGVWKDVSTWDMLLLGLRLGRRPQAVVTTTPKPDPNTKALIKKLLAAPNTAITRGSTYENANNLAPAFYENVVKPLEGTRLGREQLYAELLEDERDQLLNSAWFETVRAAPDKLRRLRYWDMAATDPEEQARQRKKKGNPDYTVGALLGKTADGIYYIVDIHRFRRSPHETLVEIRRVALRDGTGLPIRMEQEPASAGKIAIDHVRRDVLQGFAFKGVRSSGGKDVRAVPFANYAEAGHVKVLDRPWTRALLEEFDHFGESDWHDDQVDACSGAFAELSGVRPTHRPAAVPLPSPAQTYRAEQGVSLPGRPTLTRRRPGIGVAYR